MKVLMIGNSSSVHGGITSVINQITKYDWEKDGVELSFIPTFDGGNNLHKILFFAKSYCKIRNEIRTNKPDLVYMHMSHHGSVDRKIIIHNLCMRKNIPDIIHLHGSEFKKYYDLLNTNKKNKIKELLRETNMLIVLGKKWNNIIKEIEPKTNTVIINNSVFIPDEKVEWSNPFKFLFLGVLVERKGVLDLVEAVNQIKYLNFKVIIGGSGNQEERIKEKVENYNLKEKFEFVGWVDGAKKESLLKSCHALILPSYNEGLPICILEAISYGMPVISTDVGDVSSAVLNNKNGFLFTPGDVNKMASCMSEIMTKNKWDSFKDNSKKIAKEKFSDAEFITSLKSCMLKAKGEESCHTSY